MTALDPQSCGRSSAAGGALLLALVHGCVIPISSVAPQDGGPSSTVDGAGSDGSGADGRVPGDGSSAPGDATAGDGALPKGNWINVTGNLANVPSMCGTLTIVSAKPDEDLLIAGVANVGIYGSRDGGSTWRELSASSGAGQITNRPEAIVFDPQVTTRFWEAGIYGGSPFVTTDDGNAWTALGNISHTDLVSVDFSDPSRKTLVAGGHELSSILLYRSTDSGMTWSDIGGGLPAKTNCTLPLVIDAQTYLVGCNDFGGGKPGIYRTTDSGGTWNRMTGSGGGGPPLLASDGGIYWVSVNNTGMTRSLDHGKTWVDVVGAGVITTNRLVELPGGRIAALGLSYVVVSSDQGVHWTPASAELPVPAVERFADASLGVTTQGLAYSSQRRAFYIWHNACAFGPPVPVATDAIMRFDFE